MGEHQVSHSKYQFPFSASFSRGEQNLSATRDGLELEKYFIWSDMSWIFLYIIMPLQMGHVHCENQWFHRAQCILFVNKHLAESFITAVLGHCNFWKAMKIKSPSWQDELHQTFSVYNLRTSSNSALIGAVRSVWLTFQVPSLCLCWEKGLTLFVKWSCNQKSLVFSASWRKVQYWLSINQMDNTKPN